MIYGYVRVSTDVQDTENQKIGVVAKAKELGTPIDQWITDDGVSGAKEPEDRQLGKLLSMIKEGDTIISSELSRLGRKLFMVMRILEHCMKVGAKVYTVKDGYELGDNIQSKVLAFAFGLAAEIERDMISKRTKEALAKKRSEGLVLGRPIGSKCKSKKLDDHIDDLKKYIEMGLSFTAIGKLLKCHRLTVSDYCIAKGLLSKSRITQYNETSERGKKRAKKIGLNLECNYTDEELINLYISCDHSITAAAKKINISGSSLSNIISQRGLHSRINKISDCQRNKVKSKRQLERDGLV